MLKNCAQNLCRRNCFPFQDFISLIVFDAKRKKNVRMKVLLDLITQKAFHDSFFSALFMSDG